jgi:putative acetyltransferase
MRTYAKAVDRVASYGASMILVERVRRPTPEVRALVDELERSLANEYSAEQRHGLSLDAIFQPHIEFFIARNDGAVAGCGGVAFFQTFGEVKRMYVRETARGLGVARALLARIERAMRERNLRVLRLETGVRQVSAIRLYERAGFRECLAFGEYARMTPTAIETSRFYEKRLDET